MSQTKVLQRRAIKDARKMPQRRQEIVPDKTEELYSLREVESMAMEAGCVVVYEIKPFSMRLNHCPVTVVVEGNKAAEIKLQGPLALQKNDGTPFIPRQIVQDVIQRSGGNLDALRF